MTRGSRAGWLEATDTADGMPCHDCHPADAGALLLLFPAVNGGLHRHDRRPAAHVVVDDDLVVERRLDRLEGGRDLGSRRGGRGGIDQKAKSKS